MPTRLFGVPPLLHTTELYRTPFDGTRFIAGQVIVLFALVILRVALTWGPAWPSPENTLVVTEFAIDLGSIAIIWVGYAFVNPVFMRPSQRVATLLAIALSSSVFRIAAIEALSDQDVTISWIKQAFVVALLIVLAAAGLIIADSAAKARLREQQELRARSQAAEALQQMAQRETDVRADIRQRLHGSLQQSILLIERRAADLRDAAEEGRLANADLGPELAAIVRDLRNLRERDVRAATEMLRPTAIDLGAPQAIRLLMDRLPSTISFRVDIAERFEHLERLEDPQLDDARRVLIVEIVQEALSNALKHGNADHVELDISMTDDEPPAVILTFEDTGVGVPAHSRPSGLQNLRERAFDFGGTLTVSNREEGGARLRAVLPICDPDPSPSDHR